MSDDVTTEIRKALDAIVAPGDIVEIRALGDRPMVGYFDDMGAAAVEAEKLDRAARHHGIYITANPIDRALLARAANRIRPAGKGEATSDRDITGRRWLLLDFDSVRPKGIGSTDEQKTAAEARASQVGLFLAGLGWASPLEGDSGNGAHLLYPISLPNDPDADKLVSAVLAELSRRYSDDKVNVDVAVKNAARIWKLYGTMARKGDSTPERPHRRARLISVPDSEANVERAQLEALVAMTPPKPAPPPRPAPTPGARPPFDIAAWIVARGLEVSSEGQWQDGYLWELAICPWNTDHVKTAFITRSASGAVGAGCHHASCSAHDWHDLREMLEPEARERRERWEAGGRRQAGPPPRRDEDAPPAREWSSPERREPDAPAVSGFVCAAERLRDEAAGRHALVARQLTLGVSFLDDALDGMLPHDLLVVGAATGNGKTQIATLATRCALAQKKRVHYFALEAEPKEIERRLLFDALANRYFDQIHKHDRVPADVSYRNWYMRRCDAAFAPFAEEITAQVVQHLSSLHTCYRTAHFDVNDLDREIRGMEGKTDLIILDHLHYVDVRENVSENAGYREIVKRIRDLSLEAGVPVIAVAHLRKRDRMLKQLVPDADDVHGSSDTVKISTKVVVFAPGPPLEDKRQARTEWPTYMVIRKDRLDSSVTRFVALINFDATTGNYAENYTLGRACGEKFTALLDTEKPSWAKRAVQPPPPTQKLPAEDRYP